MQIGQKKQMFRQKITKVGDLRGLNIANTVIKKISVIHRGTKIKQATYIS